MNDSICDSVIYRNLSIDKLNTLIKKFLSTYLYLKDPITHPVNIQHYYDALT